MQIASVSVELYADNEWTISFLISVASIGHTLFVEMNELLICRNTKLTNIFFRLDLLNNLAPAIDEAEKEFNRLNADIKTKRKFKKKCLSGTRIWKIYFTRKLQTYVEHLSC